MGKRVINRWESGPLISWITDQQMKVNFLIVRHELFLLLIDKSFPFSQKLQSSGHRLKTGPGPRH